jgi:hypothetical protein
MQKYNSFYLFFNLILFLSISSIEILNAKNTLSNHKINIKDLLNEKEIENFINFLEKIDNNIIIIENLNKLDRNFLNKKSILKENIFSQLELRELNNNKTKSSIKIKNSNITNKKSNISNKIKTNNGTKDSTKNNTKEDKPKPKEEKKEDKPKPKEEKKEDKPKPKEEKKEDKPKPKEEKEKDLEKSKKEKNEKDTEKIKEKLENIINQHEKNKDEIKNIHNNISKILNKLQKNEKIEEDVLDLMEKIKTIKKENISNEKKTNIYRKSINKRLVELNKYILNELKENYTKRILEYQNKIEEFNKIIINESDKIRLIKTKLPNVDTNCGLFSNCISCTASKECGWCSLSNTCVPGDKNGPSKGQCSFFEYGSCSGPRSCDSYNRCGVNKNKLNKIN